ncbi:D-aminoacyl-tRNA deacylase [Enteropsectra breve]|nr:D-aminoacyl-tRNA deacylase [Enteropsectra breve]
MKIVIQHVDGATVRHEEEIIAKISKGAVLYVGFERGKENGEFGEIIKQLDLLLGSDFLANKSLLVLSQFTLFGKYTKNKPSFHNAEEHAIAKDYFNRFYDQIKKYHGQTNERCDIQRGIFGSYLQIELEGKNMDPILVEY